MVIVAAVDRSDQARAVLDEADSVAQKFEDELRVLHVMKRSEAIQAEESTVDDGAVSVDELRARAASVADELIQKYPTTAPADAVGRIGDPAAEIVAVAGDLDARYIVVSPRRRSPAGKVLFGSVAQSVLLNANCPVISIQADPYE